MVRIPNLFRTISVDQLQFPYDMKTNAVLLEFGNLMVRPRPSRAVEVYMILDIVQSLVTLVVCANVMIKRGRMRDVRIFTLRKSPYGTFIVPSAVWILLTGICVYLLGWIGFCTWIVFVQWTRRPLADWLFYIPFPWLPLALAVFYSAYGFILTCSPRSPISNMNIKKRRNTSSSSELSWYHLPIPHCAWLMNTLMVSVGVVMVIYNIIATAFNVHRRNLTHQPGRDLWKEVLIVKHTQEWLEQAPTKELLAMVKLAWADHDNIFRWCCAALASYIVILVMVILALILYSVPNQLFLMAHLCRIFPDDIPEKHQPRTFLNNVRMLRKIGWPRSLKGDGYSAFKKSWMTILIGHSQAILLLSGTAAFSVPPIYLFFVPWRHIFAGQSTSHDVVFILAYTITVAFLTAFWITALSATLTYDDIFRAVAGLGSDQDDTQAVSGMTTNTHTNSRIPLRKMIGAKLILPTRSQTTAIATQEEQYPSQTSSKASGLLRPKASFAPSSASSQGEKSGEAFDELDNLNPGNKLIVTQETTIRVERDDFEAMAAGFDPDSLPMHSRRLSAAAAPPAPYSFLSRNANRHSK